MPNNYTFFYYYKQLGLKLQKIKQLLGLKHVTISNFAYENIATTLHNHISVYYTDFILFSDFIRDKTPYLSALMRSMPVKTMGKKKLKILSPEMANILSNFEGWGPTEVAYKKKKCTFLYLLRRIIFVFSLLSRNKYNTP